MKIRLVDIGGEFCTRRTDPSLARLRETVEACIANGQAVEIDLTGIKILTPSFIDELIPPLNVKFGSDSATMKH
jgi:hypothetical protein